MDDEWNALLSIYLNAIITLWPDSNFCLYKM